LPSTINASNSGFGGIVSTGDSSGELQLQTAGTTAVTINTSQRAAFVAGTAAAPAVTTAGDTNTGIFFPAADTTAFAEGGVEAMRIDSSGNVGIGTTNPQAKLEATVSNGTHRLGINGSDTNYNVRANGGSNCSITWTENGQADRWTVGCVAGQNYLAFRSNSSNMGNGDERMRMTSGGSLCLGVTTPNSSFNNSAARLTSGQWGIGPTVDFGNFYLTNASGVGVQLISGNTSWSTLSDERLKTDLKPIENAIEKVSTLRTVTGRYIKDEDTVSRAFLIAQDVQAVLPEAVNPGEDEEQTLQLKYTDTIPLLVAAIKELKEIVDSQAERIKELEAK
jgi:hypothetical protein